MHRTVGLVTLWSRVNVTGLSSRRFAHDLTISKKALLHDFDQYIKHSAHSTDQAPVLRLLRQCAFGLRMETPLGRVAVADDMWMSLRKMGTKMDVSLHNALLRVYVSNNHQFSPSQFMEEMTKTGISPNQSTLSLLLDSHCQQGNLAGAQSLLQYMHGKGHHVTEQVYASLISGHAQSGDMDGAWKMLDVMKENGFDPSIASYTALLRGHAQQGEIDQVKETLKKMTAKKIYPSHDVYIAVLDSLSMGGHHRFIPEVLDSISNKHWMIHDLVQLAQTCASRGECESSLKLISAIFRLPSQGPQLHQSLVRTANVTFHHMIEAQQPIHMILDNLKKMTMMECVSDWIWEKLLYYAYQCTDNKAIVEIVREMHAKGLEVKKHYLFPAIANYASDLNGVKECLQVLNDLNLGLDQTVVQLLRYAVNEGSASEILTLIQESGLLDKEEERKKFIASLCVVDIQGLQDIGDEIGLAAVGVDFLSQSLITHCTKRRPNVSALARMFKMFHSSTSTPSDELTRCVEECAAQLFCEGHIEAVLHFVKTLVNQGIGPLTDDTYAYAVSASGGDRKFIAFLEKEHSVDVDTLKHYSHAREHDPMIVAEVRKLSNKIIQLAQNNRHAEVVSVYQTMLGKGLAPTIMAASSVAATLARNDITTAEELLREIEEKNWVVNLYTRNSFISSYSRRGDVENARRHYQQLLASNIKPDHFTFWCLLDAYAFHGDVAMVQHIINNDLIEHNIRLSAILAGCLVKAYINNNDIDGAVVAAEKSPVLPSGSAMALLIKRLVQLKEEALLERVKTISTFNKIQMTDILLQANLACERMEEARELINTEGYEVDMGRIARMCFGLASTGKVDAIRYTIQLLQEQGLDTSLLNTPLLKAYVYLGDMEGILSLQKQLQEDGVQPSDEFTSILSTQLRRHGITPPHRARPHIAAIVSPQPQGDHVATVS